VSAPVTSLRPGVTCNQTHHARGGGRESDGAALIGLYDRARPDLQPPAPSEPSPAPPENSRGFLPAVSPFTARRRPPSDRAGYTVIPHSSSITSPPPRVAERPVLPARTAGRLAAFGRPAARAAPLRNGCGESVGILARTDADRAIVIISLPAFMQVKELIAANSWSR
jgi:hypothetical protein